MKYRPEIDGLRAIAIIPVILFHAGIDGFSGGFVGVDVFFVISGYLITTIILSDMEQGKFSLINFYERRARRILPALFLVMFVCLPFAWEWLLPSDLQNFSRSVLATTTFSSNILFWHDSGYWGAPNALRPLLHTWSLAVEEQFYVLFPLFLMLTWRLRKLWLLGAILSVATISLLLAQWEAHHHPVLDFFMLPTRAWELAIGACIAWYFLYRKTTVSTLRSHKASNEGLSILGLFLIGYAVHTFNQNTPFPSYYALIPTIGAGLIIIFSSQQTLTGRVLGSKLPAGIGLISYSLYLWHQPIFAFARQRSFVPLGYIPFIGLIAISFLLAYSSWRWIERPFRDKQAVSRRLLFAFATTGSLAFLTLGLTAYATDGFAHRHAENGIAMQSIENDRAASKGLAPACDGAFTLSPQCRTSDKPKILVWGDSYAMFTIDGILASNPNARIIQFTKSVCGPFFGIAPDNVAGPYSNDWSKGCLQFNDHVRQWLARNHTVRYVVLASPFDNYLHRGRRLLRRDGRIVPANYALAVQEFTHTLNVLRADGVTPVVISPPPETGANIGRCLARAALFGKSLDVCDFKTDKISPFSRLVYHFMRDIGKNYRVIHLENFICRDSKCGAHFGQTFLYRDSGHLSVEGADILGKHIDLYDRIVGKGPYRFNASLSENKALSTK